MRTRTHIAIVCRGLGSGGSVAAVALRQARELTRHARVTLISDSLPENVPGIELVRAPVRDLGMLRRFRHVPDELLFVLAARRALRSLMPLDFVLCHSHAAAYLAARPLGVPFGFFVHGDINDRPKGTYDSRLTAFYRWVTPRAYQSANIVFVLAPSFVTLAERGGARHVEVIPNGIDPSDIGVGSELQPRGRVAGAPLRVLYVGRLSVEKGLDHLFDGFELLEQGAGGRAQGAEEEVVAIRSLRPPPVAGAPVPRALSPVPFELTIVGGGPLEASLRNRLTNRTHFLGVVPRARLGVLYAKHDVFCTPTLSEPFATVILEALVSGLPVIGTRVGGIPDIIEDGRNGLLVPPADARALADALTRIERDEPLRLAMALAARATVLPRLSWDRIGDRIAAAVRRVMSQ